MINDALRALETGALAQVGLLAFALAFGLVLVYALTLPKKQREHLSRMPLDDDDLFGPPTPLNSLPRTRSGGADA